MINIYIFRNIINLLTINGKYRDIFDEKQAHNDINSFITATKMRWSISEEIKHFDSPNEIFNGLSSKKSKRKRGIPGDRFIPSTYRCRLATGGHLAIL